MLLEKRIVVVVLHVRFSERRIEVGTMVSIRCCCIVRFQRCIRRTSHRHDRGDLREGFRDLRSSCDATLVSPLLNMCFYSTSKLCFDVVDEDFVMVFYFY
jgi:hypothetical protein